MSERLAGWRADTPGCADRVHLNNAGAGLMPRPVLETVQAHLAREAAIGGYEAAEEAHERVDEAYASVAEVIGAEPRNVAVTENATVSFAQALSAFDLQPGDALVTSRNDYISNQIQFLSLAARRGVTVLRADDLPEGGVDPDAVRRLLQRRDVRFVAITWVPTNSGLVQPVEAIGELCRAASVPYLVDACQAVGQMPVDVHRLHCDYLSGTARKFLRGPRGIGFLYVSDAALARGDCPLYVDMRGARWAAPDQFVPAPDATRFENWEFAYATVLGLGAAARYALEVGSGVASARAGALAAYTRQRLAGLPNVRVLDRGPSLCAIVTAAVRGVEGPDAVARLRARGINTSAIERDYAVIDMDEKNVRSGVRISPHYYNTEAEIDLAVEVLAAL